ncbi:recombinase family protein [Enterococcus sp. HY326]|uniref:recombinase family protein n=1 Tax=Enterococcus sp. HY326 TaxID=2971265 RepID=UPI0022409FF7|nr:recombinase family protein [Enterococcus sp. HY326]
MKKAALYIRVSTPQQEKEGYSIEAQTEKLNAYAKAKDYSVYKVYTDSAQSGAKLERPALQQMIEDIEDGKIDLVVVYKLDRLSRSQKNTMYLIEDVFLKNNVDFVSMQESFDTTTSFGRAMIGILSVFAQLERDNITERMGMGKLERVKKGLYMGGGNVPFGYSYNEQTNELIINEEQAEAVRRMFALYNLGESVYNIVGMLKEEFPQFKDSFSNTSVRKRLSSAYYVGKQKYAGKIYNAQHKGIISTAEFEKAQSNKAQRPHGNTFKRSYLLSGLLYCAHCGNRYSAMKSTSKYKGQSYTNYYYRCNSKAWRYKNEKGRSCGNKLFKCEELEKYVIEQVREFANSYTRQIERQTIDTKPIERKIIALKVKKSKLLDLYLSDKLDVELYDTKNEEIENAIKAYGNQLEKLGMKKTNEEMLRNVEQIKAIDFENADVEEIRKMLISCISRIELDGAKATVYFYD